MPNCGCYIDWTAPAGQPTDSGPYIHYCPKHDAAGEMLAALREALTSCYARDDDTYCLYCENASGQHIAGCPVEQIRAAIAHATTGWEFHKDVLPTKPDGSPWSIKDFPS